MRDGHLVHWLGCLLGCLHPVRVIHPSSRTRLMCSLGDNARQPQELHLCPPAETHRLSSCLVALAWPSPVCHSIRGSEPVDETSFYLTVSLSKQINNV